MSRASVHNVSIVKALKLGIGDRITVYKANMIIPQIAENLTGSDTLEIPHTCPVCGGETRIEQVNDVQSLYCTNPDCDAKKVKSFTLLSAGTPEHRWTVGGYTGKIPGKGLSAYLCRPVPSGAVPGGNRGNGGLWRKVLSESGGQY